MASSELNPELDLDLHVYMKSAYLDCDQVTSYGGKLTYTVLVEVPQDIIAEGLVKADVKFEVCLHVCVYVCLCVHVCRVADDVC